MLKTVLLRLAHTRPELRKELLGLIRKEAGWWSIDSTGRPKKPPVAKGPKGKLQNAVPGIDPTKERYIGDGPADIMDIAIRDIIQDYMEAWGRKPTKAELLAVFRFSLGGY